MARKLGQHIETEAAAEEDNFEKIIKKGRINKFCRFFLTNRGNWSIVTFVVNEGAKIPAARQKDVRLAVFLFLPLFTIIYGAEFQNHAPLKIAQKLSRTVGAVDAAIFLVKKEV